MVMRQRAPSHLKKVFVGEGWRGGRSKETDETNFKLSKCREEFSGLKKTSRKNFGHHGRIFTPEI